MTEKTSSVARCIATMFAVIASLAAAAEVGAHGSGAVCIGTYNVKCPAPWDKDPHHDWSHRAPLVFELVRRHAPDVIGMQEPVKRYVDDVLAAFPEWDWAGAGRDDGLEAGEYCPVFWRRDRFERIGSGTFWLSATPDAPGSKYPKAHHPRVCTWATLRDRTTGATVAFYNTHTEYVSTEICAAQLRMILDHMRRHAPPGAARILTGDLNFECSSPALRQIAEGGFLKDADFACESSLDGLWNSATLYRFFPKSHPAEKIRRSLAANGMDMERTRAEFPDLGTRIDHILVSHGVRVLSCGVDGTTFDGLYPSDHMPKFATVKIPPSAPEWTDRPFVDVVPLIGGTAPERAEDAAFLSSHTPVNAIAYSCSLVPEGNPAADKADMFSKIYRETSAAVARSCDIPQGVLFQSTMGHGWTPSRETPWQRVVNREGLTPYKFCPLGRDFLDYAARQARRLAEENPAFFMVDDDTRLNTGVDGCFCPLHLAEFARRTGREWTRETLVSAIDADTRLAEEWDLLLEDSLVGLMKAIRGAFPESTPGMFCACLNDTHQARRLATALAAPGQRPVVRVNNATYMSDSLRDTLYRCVSATARQIADLGGDAVVLDEADTCPHNRYSTSATRLLNHLAVAAMEGADGAKMWITNLANPQERESGAAYRNVLAANGGFLSALYGMHPRRCGMVVPLPAKRPQSALLQYAPHDWGTAYFGVAGFPYRTERAYAGEPVALCGDDIPLFSDAELTNFLSGAALLDGSAAIALSERGFPGLTGVRACKWSGAAATAEDFGDETLRRTVNGLADLRDHAQGAQVLSHLVNEEPGSGLPPAFLAPGTLLYTNSLGGVIATIATELPERPKLSRFVLYTETRKRNMAKLLSILGGGRLPGGVHYAGDAPVLCETGTSADGSRFAFLDNLGLDTLADVTLVFADAAPSRIERLCPDGSWAPIAHSRASNGVVRVETRLETLRPAVLRWNDCIRKR